MSTDLSIYIKLVGLKKVKNDLKTVLSEATINEEWKLIEDIISLIQNNINEEIEILNDRIDTIFDKDNIEISNLKTNNKLSDIIDYEIWEKLKLIIVEQLEVEPDTIEPETVIFSPYQTYQKAEHNSNNYSNVNYKYKDHWLVGLVQGLSALAEASAYAYRNYDGYSDIGCDNLDFIELIMAVEEEFDIEIPDEQSEQIKTVKDLHDIVIVAIETTA